MEISKNENFVKLDGSQLNDIWRLDRWEYLNEGNEHIVYRYDEYMVAIKVIKLGDGQPAPDYEEDAFCSYLRNKVDSLKPFLPKSRVLFFPQEPSRKEDVMKTLETMILERPKSKYDREVRFNHKIVVLEDLLCPKLPLHLKSSILNSLFYVEIKIKSSLDCLFSDHTTDEDIVKYFFKAADTPDKKELFLKDYYECKKKRSSPQMSQFYLRDCIQYMKEKSPKQREKLDNSFDGYKMMDFSGSPRKNIQSVLSAMMNTHNNNYIRIFDSHGTKLSTEECTKRLKTSFKEDWADTFSAKVADAVDTNLLETIKRFQTICGVYLGDTVLALKKSLERTGRDLKEIGSLPTNKQVLSDILESSSHTGFRFSLRDSHEEDPQVIYNILLIILTMCDTSIYMRVDTLDSSKNTIHMIDYSLKSYKNVSKLIKVYDDMYLYIKYVCSHDGL